MNPAKPVHADNHPTPHPQQPFTRDQIARRAEQLWRERNCPAGSDEAIWLEAESQLLAEAETQPVSGTPSRPYQPEPGVPVRNRTKVQDPTEADVQLRRATPPKSGSRKQLRDQ
jgi:hypothetical protein